MRIFVYFILGIAAIIVLGNAIDTYNGSSLIKQGISGLNRDIFYKAFGEFKDFLSDMSVLKADIYYHGGTYEFRKHEKTPSGEGLHIMHELKHTGSPAHVHKHAHVEHRIKPSLNILMDIGNAIQITEHRHLSGKESKEIVPWLYYAVRLNPHNEQAYSVGGFWLAVKLKKPDEAIRFLKEGVDNNPDSWEIPAMLGQIYLINKKDYKNAYIYLKKAKEIGYKKGLDRFEKKRIDTLLGAARKNL